MKEQTKDPVSDLIFTEKRASIIVLDYILIIAAWIGFFMLLKQAWPFGSTQEMLHLESSLRTIFNYIMTNASISMVVIVWALIVSARTKDSLNRSPLHKSVKLRLAENTIDQKLLSRKWLRVWHDKNGKMTEVESLLMAH